MRLFLVRHGESVDNVAGLYAGSRDSPLTTHGVLQTRRLGTHLATVTRSRPIRYVFSSDLQRAAMTAQAIVDARRPVESSSVQPESSISVVQLPDLRERDFRSLEGTRVGSRPASGTGGYRFRDPETHAEMAVRVDRFINVHLNPILERIESSAGVNHGSVVIVAHGMLLNVLLKRLLTRFSTPEEVHRLFPGRSNSDWMASWRNTAYLEAVVAPKTVTAKDTSSADGGATQGPAVVAATLIRRSDPLVRLSITGVNRVDHLQGLKKTRGGIGSAKFDNKQKTVDSFFKASPKKERPDASSGR
ncbi:phosphoglycerate mutase-like protein [Coniochaeta ligniaria NRRL 30616]|uniref:Phosphoglycerate mutase-like protein n=1 Tax=Coniochaeta ligniaria NRRL 30616 TaxID=1408157 RepID=A0A1J7IJQ8_9PEZI|nr:phosphoglycerate mutase-like protein [Coniochaeta ligniaria NRRL 30616]